CAGACTKISIHKRPRPCCSGCAATCDNSCKTPPRHPMSLQPLEPRRLLVAITGASGAVYGLRLLQVLGSTPGIEAHGVVSDAGWLTLRHELGTGPEALRPLVHTLHEAAQIGAGPA